MRTPPKGHPEHPAGESGRELLERMNGGTHEELAKWGLGLLRVAPDAQVLDIGCGGGANLRRLLSCVEDGHVSGIDRSSLSVQVSRETNEQAIAENRCDVVEGDVLALPYPDDSFDVVTAFETVYYWDLPAAFSEVNRVLKPQGAFLVCNEDNGEDAEVLELATAIPGMVVYRADELVTQLERAGLVIERVSEKEGGWVAVIARKLP